MTLLTSWMAEFCRALEEAGLSSPDSPGLKMVRITDSYIFSSPPSPSWDFQGDISLPERKTLRWYVRGHEGEQRVTHQGLALFDDTNQSIAQWDQTPNIEFHIHVNDPAREFHFEEPPSFSAMLAQAIGISMVT